MANANVVITPNIYIVVVTDDEIVDDVVAALEGRDGVASVAVVRATNDLEVA